MLFCNDDFGRSTGPAGVADGCGKRTGGPAKAKPTAIHQTHEKIPRTRHNMERDHQHPDAPHKLALLRAHGKRPGSRSAAKKADELASSHDFPPGSRQRTSPNSHT